MGRLFAVLPVWLVLADLVYGVLQYGMRMPAAGSGTATREPLAWGVKLAVGGLPWLFNLLMVAAVGFGLVVLLRLNRCVARKKVMPGGVWTFLGLLTVLVFSLPALRQWLLWAEAWLRDGRQLLDWVHPRYLMVALCLPWIGLLCLVRLVGWYRLERRQYSQIGGG